MGNKQKKSWAAIATFTGVGTLFAAAAGFIMWRVNPTLKGGVNEVLCYLNGIVVNHVCNETLITNSSANTVFTVLGTHRALDQTSSSPRSSVLHW